MSSTAGEEPGVVYWSARDVVGWIRDLGFPQYAERFRSNFIDGKKLILMDGSTLPKLGIQDYEHIKVISKDLKENVLKVEADQWDRSISLEEREELALYLREKAVTGKYNNGLTFEKFRSQRAQAERKRRFQ